MKQPTTGVPMPLTITEKQCFYPDALDYTTPDQLGLEYEPFHFNGPDGVLTGWHIFPAPDSRRQKKTILHLHGNAQNMSAHLFGSFFLAKAGYRLITFDYRGYGQSQGQPTLAGIIEDGKAVAGHLLQNPFAGGEPLVLFGQSMGAFTAAHVLPFYPEISSAILEAGLVSFRELFIESYPDANILIPDRFSTLEPLSQSRIPKLFIHGTADNVVPVSHTRRMHEAAAGPKELLILEGVGHINAPDTGQAENYYSGIFNFLRARDDL